LESSEPVRHRVHLDLEGVGALEFGVDHRRIDRTQLDHRVGASTLAAPGPDDQSGPIQGLLGRVEEVHLPRLCFHRVEPDALHRSAVPRHGHRQLELDGLGVPDEVKELLRVLGREAPRYNRCSAALGFFLAGHDFVSSLVINVETDQGRSYRVGFQWDSHLKTFNCHFPTMGRGVSIWVKRSAGACGASVRTRASYSQVSRRCARAARFVERGESCSCSAISRSCAPATAKAPHPSIAERRG
jgi:hypothetical protein